MTLNSGSSQRFGYNAEILGLSPDAFLLLRDLIAKRTGIFFDDMKRDTLADKLAGVVAARGLTSFLDYYYLLRYDPEQERHWAELMDRLAVPETYFWRQSDQLEALAQHVVPAHFARNPDAPLRIWSAACCTGEEPLSIAIALAEGGWLERARIEILASDGSPGMVERARRGLYRERAFRALPRLLRERYFQADGDEWRIDPRLHSRIQWRVANLAEPAQYADLAAADIIFCRNVFIYFSDDAIRRVADVFHEHMRTPGHLFLGASESLTRLGSSFELQELGGAFVYVKRTQELLAAPAATLHGQEPARRVAVGQEL